MFYRLIRLHQPEEFDFLSQKGHWRPLRNPDEYERSARGVSVFEQTSAARAIAPRIKPPTPYMVKLVIPAVSTLVIEPWGSRFHYPIWDADPKELLGYVEGPAVLAFSEK